MRFTAMQVLLLACFIFAQGDFAAADATEATEVVHTSQAVHDALLAAGISPQVRAQINSALGEAADTQVKIAADTKVAVATKGMDTGASCKPVGTLNCNHGGGESPSQCKDSEIAKTFKFWIQEFWGTNRGKCKPFNDFASAQQVVCSTNKITGTSYVTTKGFVGHPHKASATVGVFGFKRQACVKQSGGQEKCSSFKTSYCVDCTSTGFRYARRSPGGQKAPWGRAYQMQTDQKHKQFINRCAKKAFDAGGKLKAAFKCKTTGTTSDAEFAKYFTQSV